MDRKTIIDAECFSVNGDVEDHLVCRVAVLEWPQVRDRKASWPCSSEIRGAL